jgi:hypothetical protein
MCARPFKCIAPNTSLQKFGMHKFMLRHWCQHVLNRSLSKEEGSLDGRLITRITPDQIPAPHLICCLCPFNSLNFSKEDGS